MVRCNFIFEGGRTNLPTTYRYLLDNNINVTIVKHDGNQTIFNIKTAFFTYAFMFFDDIENTADVYLKLSYKEKVETRFVKTIEEALKNIKKFEMIELTKYEKRDKEC